MLYTGIALYNILPHPVGDRPLGTRLASGDSKRNPPIRKR